MPTRYYSSAKDYPQNVLLQSKAQAVQTTIRSSRFSVGFRAGVGNLQPVGRIRSAKQNHPARRPFTKFLCNSGPPSGTILYEFTLLPTSCIEYLRGTLMRNRIAQELTWFKFHNLPRFNNSKENGIIGRKLLRPAIPCRVCFWPATRERLSIPA